MAVNQEVRLRDSARKWASLHECLALRNNILVAWRGFAVPHYEPERLSAAEHVVHTSAGEQSVHVRQSHITPIIIIIMWTVRGYRLTTGALLSSLVPKPFS